MSISKKGNNGQIDYTDPILAIASAITAGFDQLSKVLEQLKPPVTGPIKPLDEQAAQQPNPNPTPQSSAP